MADHRIRHVGSLGKRAHNRRSPPQIPLLQIQTQSLSPVRRKLWRFPARPYCSDPSRKARSVAVMPRARSIARPSPISATGTLKQGATFSDLAVFGGKYQQVLQGRAAKTTGAKPERFTNEHTQPKCANAACAPAAAASPNDASPNSSSTSAVHAATTTASSRSWLRSTNAAVRT